MVTSRTESAVVLAVLAVLAVPSAACSSDDEDSSDHNDSGADAAADADTDADSDTDTDSDTDVDDAGPGNTAIWVTAGYTQTCAVIDGGYVKCWGYGHFGELGYGTDLYDDTDADYSLPSTLPFVRVGETVSQLEGGINATCALLTDGGVKCWGYFLYYLLGIDVPSENTPVPNV